MDEDKYRCSLDSYFSGSGKHAEVSLGPDDVCITSESMTGREVHHIFLEFPQAFALLQWLREHEQEIKTLEKNQ